MSFPYIGVEEARNRNGLRMVVVGNVPSPWGEAAKGILHIKGIAWAAVRLVYDSELLREWAGQRSGPVAIYDNEQPRSGWAEILLFAERLAPMPSLVPADPAERALVFGISHEICGEEGLGWCLRDRTWGRSTYVIPRGAPPSGRIRSYSFELKLKRKPKRIIC